MHASIGRLAENLNALEHILCEGAATLVVAESCTGGMLASSLVDRAGASNWFYGGFVTYQACAKIELLGVKESVLSAHGLVSSETALAMALGALKHSTANYAIALTGVAGPAGDGSQSGVGELWIGWASETAGVASSEWFELSASRNEFRLTACALAVEGFVKRFNPCGDTV